MDLDQTGEEPVIEAEGAEQSGLDTTGEPPVIPEGGETPPEDEGKEEVVVSIGDEDPDPEQEQERSAPQWVRDLRKADREKARRIRELEDKLKTTSAPAKVTVGPKPTLESCDFDEARHEKALETWLEAKRQAGDDERKEQEARDRQQKAWNERLELYESGKKALKVADYSEAEEAIKTAFSVTQQSVIVAAAEKPELIVYALGKNDKERAALAAITDPVKFAYAIGKLETKLKVTPRKSVPPPERRVTGSAPGTATDSTLARLEAEAAASGDRSKVIAYKRQQKQKSAA